MGIRNLSTASISTGTKRSKFWDQYAVVIPPAFESIATFTVGAGGQSTINFTSIPTTYKHLQLRTNYVCSTSPGTIRYRMGNGSLDTGTNYSTHTMSNQSVWVSAPDGDVAYPMLDSQVTYPWSAIYDFTDYANTNKYKTVRVFTGGDNNGGGVVGMSSSMWRSFSAITNISIYTQSGNFSEGSKFSLYGVKG